MAMMRWREHLAAAVVGGVLATLLTPSVRAQTKAPITHEALWLMPRVGSPALSPDGRSAVFSVVEPAYDEKEQRSDLWMVATDGSEPPRRLTTTKAAEANVAWSPDSRRVAFS